jgi:hypothetical protein
MGYTMQDGRHADVVDVVLHPSAARTAGGNAGAQELGDRAAVRLTLVVSAASGTDRTLDVAVETSRDGATWYSAGAFAQATGTGTQRKTFVVDRYVRCAWTIGGTDTPTFAFDLRGEAA